MACFCPSKMFRGTVRMKFMVVLWLFSLCTMNIQATTHWMVTESGLIQPWADSPFEMSQPYDLLAFLNQDTRWKNIVNLHHDLSNRQVVINKLWEDLKNKADMSTVSTKNENCIKAGQLNFFDWYASFLEDGKSKKISDEEYLLYKPGFGHNTEVPDCKKISSLTFSMLAFEHLEGMIQRENLTAAPELALPELISPIMTVEQFGHWAAVCLKKNSSSWLHYNMASLYWRVRGNAPKAMECSRRAVHYAPRDYKDVALLSLGSILHRSKKTEDAVIVLGAAVDHDPQYHINHFILATAHAVLGEFNSSMRHLDQCMKLSPGFDLAIRYRYAMLCHIALWQRVSFFKDIVEELREELSAFSNREGHWLKSQAAFLRTMKHEEEFDYMSVENNSDKMTELTGLDIRDLKREGDENSVIHYFLDGHSKSLGEKLERKGVYNIETVFSLERLVNHIEKHASVASNFVQTDLTKEYEIEGEILKEIGPMPVFTDKITDAESNIQIPSFELPEEPELTQPESESEPFPVSKPNAEVSINFFDGHIMYPTSMVVNRKVEEFDKEKGWPSPSFCTEASTQFPDLVEALYPVFLPFENKGVRLKSLLTDQIGVPANEEYELPWYPPLCPQDKEALFFTQKKPVKQQMSFAVINTGFLRQKLLEYVSDGNVEAVARMQDVEIGHRIYTAMQRKLAPNWILYTLSSLYWRVRGSNGNALHCLMSANRTVDPKYRDIVLTSLASVFLEMGYLDDGLLAVGEALRTNPYEPATNFVIAQLNMVKKNRSTQMFHLRQVVRVDPNFLNGLSRNLLNGWSCILQQLSSIQGVYFRNAQICANVEPGVNLLCANDGSKCEVTDKQCSISSDKGTFSRLLEFHNEELSSPPSSPEQMDDSMFDAFIENMPLERNARAAHQQNYESMLRSLESALKGCGPRGCQDIQPEDLSLKDEDCSFHHIQIGYWLHVINFKQVLADGYSRIPAEIAALSPSNKKVPECKIPSDSKDDFYLERISKVDPQGWEPVLSLMHQFAEVFELYEYATLGTKIAKYVDAKPRWWVGLLAAGWWCGAGGDGACALRCLAAAHARAPAHLAPHALRALAALLHLQSKPKEAKDIAYLSFYAMPKNKIEAFLVGVSHSYLSEYEQAVWMYRYALTYDDKFLPAKACLHATMCLMLFVEPANEAKSKGKPT